MTTAARVIISYYAALRLSAGAAVAQWPLEAGPSKPPIVRRANNGGPAGFDRREVIAARGRIAIVTIPFATDANGPACPN